MSLGTYRDPDMAKAIMAFADIYLNKEHACEDSKILVRESLRAAEIKQTARGESRG